MSTDDLDGTYWYCQDHHRVEAFAQADSTKRIGPFATEAEAARALETIAERERAYDAEDAAWDGRD